MVVAMVVVMVMGMTLAAMVIVMDVGMLHGRGLGRGHGSVPAQQGGPTRGGGAVTEGLGGCRGIFGRPTSSPQAWCVAIDAVQQQPQKHRCK